MKTDKQPKQYWPKIELLYNYSSFSEEETNVSFSWLPFLLSVVNPSSRDFLSLFSFLHFCICPRLLSHLSSTDVAVTQTLQNI